MDGPKACHSQWSKSERENKDCLLMHIYGIEKSDMKVQVTQSCPTFCDPMDYTAHGIFQAIILEWVPIPFSRGSSQPRAWTQVSCIAGGFFISWATREGQEYWSGQPIPSPADLPNPGIELGSSALQADLYQLSRKMFLFAKQKYSHNIEIKHSDTKGDKEGWDA